MGNELGENGPFRIFAIVGTKKSKAGFALFCMFQIGESVSEKTCFLRLGRKGGKVKDSLFCNKHNKELRRRVLRGGVQRGYRGR